VAVLWIYFFIQGWKNPDYTVAGSGMMPVAVVLIVSAVAMIVVSLLTRPPEEARIAKFFPKAGL